MKHSLPPKAFSLDDFKSMLRQEVQPSLWRRMLSVLPYCGVLAGTADASVKREFRTVIGIIDSMTLEERSNPRVITKHRRNRIAKGAGVQARRVNVLLREYQVMADVFAKLQQDQP